MKDRFVENERNLDINRLIQLGEPSLTYSLNLEDADIANENVLNQFEELVYKL